MWLDLVSPVENQSKELLRAVEYAYPKAQRHLGKRPREGVPRSTRDLIEGLQLITEFPLMLRSFLCLD